MAYSARFPVGRRVRVTRNFVFEGYQISKGETGEVVSNGGNSATIILDQLHPGLPENALFFSPPAWALDDEETAKDALVTDRFYRVRESVRAMGIGGVAMMALTIGLCGGKVVADILDDDHTQPSVVSRLIRSDLDGKLYRFTLQKERADDDYTQVVWKMISRVEVNPSNPKEIIAHEEGK